MSATDRTVLVVEDDTELRAVYEQSLAGDYAVRTAGDVATALEKYDHLVDVVLLDRRLPDGDGEDVLPRLRAAHGDARIAMVTAVAPDFDVIEMDFDAYVTKPVREDDLRALVDSLCSHQEDRLAREGELII